MSLSCLRIARSSLRLSVCISANVVLALRLCIFSGVTTLNFQLWVTPSPHFSRTSGWYDLSASSFLANITSAQHLPQLPPPPTTSAFSKSFLTRMCNDTTSPRNSIKGRSICSVANFNGTAPTQTVRLASVKNVLC